MIRIVEKAVSGLRARPSLLWTPLACGTFLVLCAARVIPALAIFTSAPINGAFQLFNPLKRLANGEILTRDFDFFHGIGTLLLHYPLFSWCGGDLFASELSRHLLSPLAFLLCFLIVGAALRIPLWIAGIGAAATFALGDFLGFGSGAVCGNSMIGLRSTVPVLAIPAAMWMARLSPFLDRLPVRHAVMGVTLGLGTFIATEQGLASFAVHLAVLALIPSPGIGLRRRLGCLGIMFLSFAASYALLTGAATGWRVIETIRFSLLDVTKDQFWYYGAPPNPVPEWGSLASSTEMLYGFWAPLVFLVAEISFILRGRNGLGNQLAVSIFVIIVLAVSMTVQLLHLAAFSHYHLVSIRNMGVVAMIWGFRGYSKWLAPVSPPVAHRVHPVILILPVFAFCCLAFQRADATMATIERREAAIAGDETHGRIRLSREWSNDLECWRNLAMPGISVSGTYRSLPDDFSPGEFGGPDYIIHSLGKGRDRFLNSLKNQQPDWFHTINPRYSDYESWLQARHWDVYAYLLQHYEPETSSDYHVFWKRSSGPRSAPGDDTMIAVQPIRNGWESGTLEGGTTIYRVTVAYETHNPLGALPFFGRVPRYYITPRSISNSGDTTNHLSCSLPPDEASWVFPMILKQGERARFEASLAMATPGARLTIHSVHMIPITNNARLIDALTGSNETKLFKPSRGDESGAGK